jgi:hypothetical protein
MAGYRAVLISRRGSAVRLNISVPAFERKADANPNANTANHAHPSRIADVNERFVNPRRVNPTKFLTELKRRNVYRAAIASLAPKKQ